MHASKQKQTGYNSIYFININNIYNYKIVVKLSFSVYKDTTDSKSITSLIQLKIIVHLFSNCNIFRLKTNIP